jgi:hypothetical protein
MPIRAAAPAPVTFSNMTLRDVSTEKAVTPLDEMQAAVAAAQRQILAVTECMTKATEIDKISNLRLWCCNAKGECDASKISIHVLVNRKESKGLN